MVEHLLRELNSIENLSKEDRNLMEFIVKELTANFQSLNERIRILEEEVSKNSEDIKTLNNYFEEDVELIASRMYNALIKKGVTDVDKDSIVEHIKSMASLDIDDFIDKLIK